MLKQSFKELAEELFGLGLGHGWEQLQIGLTLAIQRVNAGFDGVAFEEPQHSQ